MSNAVHVHVHITIINCINLVGVAMLTQRARLLYSGLFCIQNIQRYCRVKFWLPIKRWRRIAAVIYYFW